jgi:hypothetical protein
MAELPGKEIFLRNRDAQRHSGFFMAIRWKQPVRIAASKEDVPELHVGL